ncbi:MAG TPA: aromatic acid exporter family protein [Acidothermales bacterium]
MPRLTTRVKQLRRSAVERLRRRGRAGIAWMVRLTAAAVASYEVARLLFPETLPLLAPLTALLVVQVTPMSLLASGLDRVISVVLGVSVAVVFSEIFGLSWWSLGLIIAVSIAVGQILRLQANLLEVPISAMLVLGVGAVGAETAAWQRVTETIVGAGVGVLFNLLFPPKVATDAAGAALEGLGEDLARLLEHAADELDDVDDITRDGRLVDRASAWLDEARIITHGMPNVGAALLRAEESRRLNVRALAQPDSGPALRHGMESLEHASVTVRSMFRAIVDAARQRDAVDGFGPDLSIAYASVLRDFAEPLRTFGRLVRTEARPRDASDNAWQLHDALERILEARARLTDLVLADPRADPALNTLTITLLATADRLLRELDEGELVRRTPPPLPQRFSLRDRRDRRVEP